MKKFLCVAAIILIGSVVFASGKKDNPDVRKIKYAYAQTARPVSYTDAAGKAAGYDVEVIRLIDERLPQYEIEFIGTSQEDAWLGTETGKYQLCTTNSYRTAAREEKYLFADQNSGGSLSGFAVLNKNAAAKSFADVSDLGLSLVPIQPDDGMWSLVADYNKANPAKQVKVEALGLQVEPSEKLRWISEGRYDVFLTSHYSFGNLVRNEGAPLGNLNSQLTFNPILAVKTWALINIDEKDFRDAYQKVLVQLRDEGILSKLSIEYFGADVFTYFE